MPVTPQFPALASLVALLVAGEAPANDFTLAEPLPFAISGAAGSLLPVTAEEIAPGPTCLGLGIVVACPALGPAIYYRIQLDSGSLLTAMAAFVGGGSQGFSGFVADDDEETRRPASAIAAGSPTFEQGPLFTLGGPLLAGQRSEVLFRAYPSGTEAPASPSGSFRLKVQPNTNATTQLAPVPLVQVGPGGPGLALARIATGLDRPVFATAPAGDPRIFVVEQSGRIRVWKAGAVLPTPFLDLSAAIALDPFAFDEERGLLGLAFPPDYASSGLFYVLYVRPDPGSPSGPGLITVARHAVSGNPDVASPAGTLLLSIAKPAPPAGDPEAFEAYHNGGQLAFGPDGLLYVGVGDGGGWTGYDPWECAQNASSPLGKLVRLDLAALTPGVSAPATSTCPTLAPTAGVELWGRGLRNPYRFSFDRETGDLYVPDVGEDTLEEVNALPATALGGAGPNFGWDVMEGTGCVGEDPAPAPACGSATFVDPIYTYGPGGGSFCEASVVGGYAYRGTIAELRGRYVFADYCQGFVRSLQWDGGGGIIAAETLALAPDAGSVDVITAIGQDGAGELYVVDAGLGPSEGELFRLVPEPAGASLALGAAAALAGLARPPRSTRAE